MNIEPRGGCSVCQSTETREFFSFSGLPVHVCLLWPSEEGARACPRGEIRLSCCEKCGFIRNDRFDPGLLAYAEGYENSLRFSEFFQGYIRGYARELVERYDLRGKEIIEIGCGDGEFLSLLCELGENKGVGFDPSYTEGKSDLRVHEGVRIIPDYYSGKYGGIGADLIVCRQVFEHIPNPREFLENLRQVIGSRPETAVEFEVPNVSYTLQNLSLWDVIYEHCSYFSKASLKKIFSSCGYRVIHVGETYEDQFLSIGAALAYGGSKGPEEGDNDLAEVLREVTRFQETYPHRIKRWQEVLQGLVKHGKRVALWGAGARGVNFLNMLGVNEEIGCVVDINPHKHGAYLPGTAHRVGPPESLRSFQPDLVIIMNMIYRSEIERALRSMDLSSEVRVA